MTWRASPIVRLVDLKEDEVDGGRGEPHLQKLERRQTFNAYSNQAAKVSDLMVQAAKANHGAGTKHQA